MKIEAPEVLQIPNEVYDSDGDGNENWQDDIDFIDFEEDKNEGKIHYIRGKKEQEKRAVDFLSRIGRKTTLLKEIAA